MEACHCSIPSHYGNIGVFEGWGRKSRAVFGEEAHERCAWHGVVRGEARLILDELPVPSAQTLP